ncbi:uncharacterized protein LOC117300212 [Asterias rubens]|uniref:uncharacterized protein LOC117300212 n=1 Tax=Asterias rubens TaxID=7604 RepID=UPI0014555389|nr:uncharacterized protein LOC117300212 [Asterias rubens]
MPGLRRSVSYRELRQSLPAFLGGAVVATVVLLAFVGLHRPAGPERRRRPTTLQLPEEHQCPECPESECPRCPEKDKVFIVPKTLKAFLGRHWDVMKESAVVIARTQMKSVPSYVVSLHPTERDPYISHSLIERGGWQEPLIVRMCKEMNKAPSDAFFVDIGAYVGTLALGLSACGHKVIVFEPMTRNTFLLKESVFLNQLSTDRFTIHNMAVGNFNGRACFSASSSNQGDGRFVSGGDDSHLCASHENAVQMIRLQDVLKEDTRIWTLHIDAQGFEAAVLAGAEAILTGTNPPQYLHVKLGQPYSKETMSVTRGLVETLGWLKDIGYSLRDTDNEPIRDVSKFVWQLGHESAYVLGIHGVK